MTMFATADLYDKYGDRLQVAAPVLNNYGGDGQFSGPATTVKVFEDNSLIRDIFEEAGNGRVLVVDGGGSLMCALMGDVLARLAHDNGWAGAIIYGCIRDSAIISGIDIGVKALNTHPRKSVKRGTGDRDVPVHFADVIVRPDDYVYADQDGWLVTDRELK